MAEKSRLPFCSFLPPVSETVRWLSAETLKQPKTSRSHGVFLPFAASCFSSNSPPSTRRLSGGWAQLLRPPQVNMKQRAGGSFSNGGMFFCSFCVKRRRQCHPKQRRSPGMHVRPHANEQWGETRALVIGSLVSPPASYNLAANYFWIADVTTGGRRCLINEHLTSFSLFFLSLDVSLPDSTSHALGLKKKKERQKQTEKKFRSDFCLCID